MPIPRKLVATLGVLAGVAALGTGIAVAQNDGGGGSTPPSKPTPAPSTTQPPRDGKNCPHAHDGQTNQTSVENLAARLG